ncbi:hypothetical protein [Chryseobacterium paridis]|uniref:Outer membrane protein beta-barrel domain-containing protein n=1 Tax=Chryseobacterium paridis TaxID=2800328 RepID=A0ABS1FYR0_9FLAO|nr:hypothetical protein [Chryseobacterium paridis]MBK1897539.1 hypothetical protein [Chryseobacterium paridis]
MKNNKLYVTVAFLSLVFNKVNSQTVNWGGLADRERHILNVNVGAEYGAIVGLGYGYKFNSKLFPTIINIEASVPMGERLFDDFKTKAGANVRWLKIQNLQLSTKAQGIFRKYENENVQLMNFGLDMSGTVGYYRPKWFAAVEIGFDKAIVTHFKHSDHYREIYPEVKDGWYEPSTGGNFYGAVQGGYSFSNQEIYFKVGGIVSQDLKTKPQLPYLLQVGYNYKLPF